VVAPDQDVEVALARQRRDVIDLDPPVGRDDLRHPVGGDPGRGLVQHVHDPEQ
jgi:hypothetical protein